jgi:nicotinate phosphoribosyltransferase
MTPPTNANSPWVNDRNVVLLVDLYELTMLQAYWKERMFDEAVFSLFAPDLPQERNYLLACGLDDALHYLEDFRFDSTALEFLRTRQEFSDEFLNWLKDLRFTGDVYAIPEGTPVFANEPLLEVVAPLPAAQIVETFLLNQINFQTVLASKAARSVNAAGPERSLIDFGIRRMFGTDAALKSARAFHIAGVKATSNVLAGAVYGVPIAGTMAHSYIQAHDDELEAFRRFTETYPETILLVDTYDTLESVRKIVQLARELGDRFRVSGIRLDSGDLVQLAFEARTILDAAGLNSVSIIASSGLDEYKIEKIVRAGAPIAGFGVGTSMGVSADAPTLDMVYKLTSYAGDDRVKTSPGKETYPGRKQVFRQEERGFYVRDILGAYEEKLPGTPLLQQVMAAGKRLTGGCETLSTAHARARDEVGKLPERLRAVAPAKPAYEVQISAELRRRARASATKSIHRPA